MGFAGTLDPLATGLMIIGTDGSPSVIPHDRTLQKTYVTTIRPDGTTESHDLEKPIVYAQISKKISKNLSRIYRKVIRENFLGNIQQVPLTIVLSG